MELETKIKYIIVTSPFSVKLDKQLILKITVSSTEWTVLLARQNNEN